MPFRVDDLFECLAKDGDWHSLNELATIIHMEEHRVEEIAQFFAHYSFIQINSVKNKAKIDPELREIFISPSIDRGKRLKYS